MTPDFEDWLERQDIPIEETTEVNKYLQYLMEEIGISGGTVEVAKGVYESRYLGLAEYDIRPIERHYLYQGEPFVETRYAIKGAAGLWGRVSAYTFASERAEEAGNFEIRDLMLERLRQMEQAPTRTQIRWQEKQE